MASALDGLAQGAKPSGWYATRGICPVCSAELALTKRGTLRRHKGIVIGSLAILGADECPGSGQATKALSVGRSDCSVEACDRKCSARGYCPAHYAQFRKQGKPTADPLKLVGPRHPASCEYPGCDRKHSGHGYCEMHRRRQLKHGSPDVVKSPGWRPGDSRNPRWTGEAVTYGGMHLRLRNLKGRAADCPCHYCDQPAACWSYDHLDPDEQIGRSDGRKPYSLKPEHYEALCWDCHNWLDHNWLRVAPADRERTRRLQRDVRRGTPGVSS